MGRSAEPAAGYPASAAARLTASSRAFTTSQGIVIERPSISMEPLPRELAERGGHGLARGAHQRRPLGVRQLEAQLDARAGGDAEPVGELVEPRPQAVLHAHLAHQGHGLAQRGDAVGEQLGEVAAEARVPRDQALHGAPGEGDTAESSSALMLAAGAHPRSSRSHRGRAARS